MGTVLSDELRARVLSEISPTEAEIQKQAHIISELSAALESRAAEIGQAYSFIEPQGSTGRKQTQLRGAADIDLFVGLRMEDYSFSREHGQQVPRDAIDNLMNRLVDEWFVPAASRLNLKSIQKTYSQHPYLSLEMDGLEADILACFDLSSEELQELGPITAVDRTVHHTSYIAQRLTPMTRETARILKSFVRACHAYGDRCAVGQMGLTGVSLELVAILAEDFDSCLERVHSLDIDPIDPLDRTEEELRSIASFRDDHVILIDPTDTARNVASSFTLRAYRWVKHRIEQLWDVSRRGEQERAHEMLIESEIPIDPLPKEAAAHSFSFEYLSTGGSHYTVIRDKLYSLARMIEGQLKNERTGEARFGEILSEVYFEDNRYALGFLVEQPIIEPLYTRRGPPSDLTPAADRFRDAHSRIEERDGHLWSTETREWTNAEDMIRHLVEKNPIRGVRPFAEQSEASLRVLNVLARYVLEIEPSFRAKMTRVKDTASIRS